MIEQIDVATRMARSIDLPVIIDGNAGFGDPLHTRRTITAYEDAGLAGIHLEYQVYLKRTSYHKGLEHIVPTEEFLEKIRHALDARRVEDLIDLPEYYRIEAKTTELDA